MNRIVKTPDFDNINNNNEKYEDESEFAKSARLAREAFYTNPSALFKLVEDLTRKDIREAASTLSDSEARYLVDFYYMIQGNRVRCGNQIRSMQNEPNMLLGVFNNQYANIEATIKKALEDYVKTKPIGRWLLSNYGIGPVISAGLIANIKIERAPTAGHIWSFVGYNPNMVWEKSQKRPYHAGLKKLCWHIGQSFMKFSRREECFYGHLYLERKAYEIQRNEAGELAGYAKHMLTTLNYKKDTVTKTVLESGKLSDGQIDARARRWAVKIFLSHMQQIWWKMQFGEDPPKPFAISILGHAHMIPPAIDPFAVSK